MLLKLSDKAYEHYITRTSRNKKTCRLTAAKKMTRNLALSIRLTKTRDGSGVIYSYGDMRFMVKNSTVEWIENGHKRLPMWYKNKKKYDELNRQLGIK